MMTRHLFPLLILFCGYAPLFAQAPSPPPDTLIFTNGEKLIGQFEYAHKNTVTFKSESVGEISVDWSKIKELHSSKPFAVIKKGISLGRHSDLSGVPQGTVAATDKTITLTPASGPPVTIPVASSAHILDVPTFQQDVLHNPGVFEDWRGSLTAGATVVQATQQSHAFFGAVNLVRAIPGESWLDARNRTIFNFNASTGSQLQPNTPRIKTEILHSDIERDQYFRGSNLYGFGQASFDHNYSQGLDLQQIYSGGIGFTAIKKANETLDFKGSISYERQTFQLPTNNHDLAVSVFAESFARKFARGIQFIEQISGTPAWNASVYSVAGNAGLTLPVYKRFAFSITALDTYLNNPPGGFKKNSLQVTTGLTYSLK